MEKNINWREISATVTQNARNAGWYPRHTSLIVDLINMGLYTEEDISQEFICYWLANAPIHIEEKILYPLDVLEGKKEIDLKKAVKFLTKMTGYQVINKLSRRDLNTRVCYGLEQYTEPVRPHTERRGLTLRHLFFEYGITDKRYQRAIFKRIHGETLTPTERKHLQRFRKNYNDLF